MHDFSFNLYIIVTTCYHEFLVDAYFNKENGLKKAEEWIPFLNEFDLGVKILVCDQCSADENSKHTSKISGIMKITH